MLFPSQGTGSDSSFWAHQGVSPSGCSNAAWKQWGEEPPMHTEQRSTQKHCCGTKPWWKKAAPVVLLAELRAACVCQVSHSCRSLEHRADPGPCKLVQTHVSAEGCCQCGYAPITLWLRGKVRRFFRFGGFSTERICGAVGESEMKDVVEKRQRIGKKHKERDISDFEVQSLVEIIVNSH